jgi:putative ABC transport system permease protein
MSLFQDIRHAFRLLRRSPQSAGIALLSIALSVAAAAVVFAAMKSVLLDPLPFARPHELVLLRAEFPHMQEQSHGDWVIWNDSREIARRTRTLAEIGTYRNAVFDLAGDSHSTPLALYGLLVSANLFHVLGVQPMLGRSFLPAEDQPSHADVMILSYGLWTRRFHRDPSIVGRTVITNGQACLVIGVMPPGFNFPMRREAAHTPSPYVEFWATPLRMPVNPEAGMGAVARLRQHVSLAAAQQDLASMSTALAHDFPALNRDRVLTLNLLRDRTVGPAARGLWMLMAAAILFMLIGCANVANLLLARSLARRREMDVRSALGAGRWRIVRQLLTESCVLGVLGGVGGFVLTAAAWKVLPALAPVSIPRLAATRVDGIVLAFALAVAAINGLVFGLAPALRAALRGGLGSRGAASARHDRLRAFLVAVEVALSVMLVVIGGQVLAGFVRLLAIDPGFDAGRVLASVVLPAPVRYPDPAQRALFYRRILDAVRALPGVESAGVTDALPFSGENHGGFVSAGDPAHPRQLVAEIDVTGGDYLQSMGIHLLAGRWFRDEDMRTGGDAALVNTLVAGALWPGRKAVGQRLCVDCTPEHPDNWKRVVGVVSSASHAALDESAKGNLYLAAGALESSVFLTVRTVWPAGQTAQAIRRAIATIDPNQPVFLSASMRELIADSIAGRRFVVALLTVTACLALFLAAAGVYGVISYTTSLRTPEIGIRMALGAAPRHVFALIFRQGFATAAIGLILGLAAAVIAMRALRTVLVGLDAGHPESIWIAAATVTATAAIACWIPARRATRVDPSEAIRQE